MLREERNCNPRERPKKASMVLVCNDVYCFWDPCSHCPNRSTNISDVVRCIHIVSPLLLLAKSMATNPHPIQVSAALCHASLGSFKKPSKDSSTLSMISPLSCFLCAHQGLHLTTNKGVQWEADLRWKSETNLSDRQQSEVARNAPNCSIYIRNRMRWGGKSIPKKCSCQQRYQLYHIRTGSCSL